MVNKQLRKGFFSIKEKYILSKNKEKILIVGQGLAGSLLAFELLQNGQEVFVIDNKHQHSSSIVAGGAVNPITGQRFVKSWRIDELLVSMSEIYGKMEAVFGIKLWKKRSIVRILQTVKQENDWLGRTSWQEWQGFIGTNAKTSDFEPYFFNVEGVAEVLQGGKLEIAQVLFSVKNYLLNQKKLEELPFSYANLKINANSVEYKGVFYDKIVFCEGWQAINNPFFNYLPFNISKGEALIVKIDEEYPFSANNGANNDAKISIKNDVMISHLHDNLYWVGATNVFEDTNPLPTEKGLNELENRLKKALKLPFTIEKHIGGLRPATLDRRPFLGQHPLHEPIFIFNGLGTKGSSLAPYLTKKMIGFLLEKQILDAEINIDRYFGK